MTEKEKKARKSEIFYGIERFKSRIKKLTAMGSLERKTKPEVKLKLKEFYENEIQKLENELKTI